MRQCNSATAPQSSPAELTCGRWSGSIRCGMSSAVSLRGGPQLENKLPPKTSWTSRVAITESRFPSGRSLTRYCALLRVVELEIHQALVADPSRRSRGRAHGGTSGRTPRRLTRSARLMSAADRRGRTCFLRGPTCGPTQAGARRVPTSCRKARRTSWSRQGTQAARDALVAPRALDQPAASATSSTANAQLPLSWAQGSRISASADAETGVEGASPEDRDGLLGTVGLSWRRPEGGERSRPRRPLGPDVGCCVRPALCPLAPRRRGAAGRGCPWGSRHR
jgi:hypothetical protein